MSITIKIERLKIIMSSETVKKLYEAAKAENNAVVAALKIFQQSAAAINKLLDESDIEGAKELIADMENNSAALVAATMQNTPLEDHIPVESVQAAADTLPDTANAPADGSEIV